jgi:hypothetical protein
MPVYLRNRENVSTSPRNMKSMSALCKLLTRKLASVEYGSRTPEILRCSLHRCVGRNPLLNLLSRMICDPSLNRSRLPKMRPAAFSELREHCKCLSSFDTLLEFNLLHNISSPPRTISTLPIQPLPSTQLPKPPTPKIPALSTKPTLPTPQRPSTTRIPLRTPDPNSREAAQLPQST